MTDSTIPLVVLGGRDHATTTLPEGGRDKHVLRGYKAVRLQIGGRPLIEVLIGRFRDTGTFGPFYIAGPLTVYERLAGGDVHVVDTDASFGDNIRHSIEAVMAAHPASQVAYTTCDILPDPEELRRVLGDLHRHQPCDFWMPQIRAPADLGRLGESAWKPKYGIRPEGEDTPVPTLPGHLIVADPRAMRLSMAFRIFDLAYSTRNRPVRYRRSWITRRALGALIAEDFRRLLRLRPPNVTAEMVYHGLSVAKLLVSGNAGQRKLEHHLHRMWVRRSHRKRHPDRRGWAPVLDILSLARDIDTEEEARELVDELGQEAS